MMSDVNWIFDIVYVFDLSKSLLTIGTRIDKSFCCHFDSKTCVIIHKNEHKVVETTRVKDFSNNLYRLILKEFHGVQIHTII
jgi:hypothetical protein